ncbi:MAG: rod shape-determining protein RodA [Deltaproteobacteria bacterium]|nr:rod shape-determining protein RodA [Deltaproteobacteria bacterium]
MARTIQHRLRDDFDWPLFLVVCVIATLGVVNLYSATSAQTGARAELYIQQIYWLALGGGVAVIVAAIDYKVYERYAYGAYIGSIAALVLVFLLGKSIRGTHRWIQLGSFLFQPSEFVKLCLMLAVARYVHRDQRSGAWSLRDLIAPGALIALPLGLIMAQPDLGTALIVGLVAVSTLSLVRISLRTLGVIVGGGLVGGTLLWLYGLKQYQKERLTSFMSEQVDVQGTGWQAHQSMVAIGSGRWWGQGFMQSTQNQHHFLPDTHTDFPFPVWAQEQGFFGVVIVLLLYLFLILWALRIASLAKDRFGAAIAVGVTALFFWHVVFNVGMVTRSLPVVGVTLPFFSYGGSSVLAILIGVGLLMNVSMRRRAL